MTNDFVHVEDLMKEWVEFGDHEENPFMRFMAYWVAFNMLYEPYRKGGEVKDFPAIMDCYASNASAFGGYDPFDRGGADIFMSDEAKQLYREDPDPEAKIRRIRRKNRRELMFAVYCVRCNFFHGNKRFGDETDREFVRSAAAIVRGYLGTLTFIPAKERGAQGSSQNDEPRAHR